MGSKLFSRPTSALVDKINLLNSTGKWEPSADKMFQALKIVDEIHKALHGLKEIPKDEEKRITHVATVGVGLLTLSSRLP